MIGHDEFGFSDPDYQNARGQYGGLVPVHDSGCACFECMKAGINGFAPEEIAEEEQREEEADNGQFGVGL